MTREELLNYIKYGREIEFKYNGKMFSITYSPADQEDYISFCEFYQEPIDVKRPQEVADIVYNGVTVIEMLESITEQDIWIY